MFIILLLTLCILWLLKRYIYLRKWNHFPGAKSYQALPLIGHAYKLSNDPIGELFKMQKKHGDIFRLDVGSTPTIVIAGLNEANEVFKSEVNTNQKFIFLY